MKTQEKNRTKGHSKKFWNGVPATIRKTPREASLYNFLIKSVSGHAAALILICLTIFLLNLFGITPKIKDGMTKVKDIAFTLAGPPKGAPAQKSGIQPASSDKAPESEVKTSSSPQIKPAIKKSGTGEIPDFEIPAANVKSMTSGMNSSSSSRRHALGLDTSALSVSKAGGSSSLGDSPVGGSGFNKDAAKNLITVYDISPYVNELKREIRWNWKIPPTAGGKKVELFLRIARDGRLMILNVKKTSEAGEVDNAALEAVRKSLPLNPLPAKYNKGYLDLVFSFDSATNSVSSRY